MSSSAEGSRVAVHFEIRHVIEAPLTAAEQLLTDADLGPGLAAALPSIQSIEVVSLNFTTEQFERRWRFHARAPLGLLRGLARARHWLMWEERFVYQCAGHQAHWWVYPQGDAAPDAAWRHYFSADGSYHLDVLGEERCERLVQGQLRVELPGLGRLIERAAVAELRRAYRAEARLLTAMACTTSR